MSSKEKAAAFDDCVSAPFSCKTFAEAAENVFLQQEGLES